MDFKFLNSKLIEDLEKKFTFFLFYNGYDIQKFTSSMLDTLKLFNQSIFMINFDENIIDKIVREGAHKIIKTETTKRHNLYLNNNGIFSLSSKVLLLDLITNKLSADGIGYLLVGSDKKLENESKEIFILKFLIHNLSKTKIIFIHDDVNKFLNDFQELKENKILDKFFKLNILPRNHPIVYTAIEYSLNVKNIQIYENNLKYEEIEEIQENIKILYQNCYDELIRLALKKNLIILEENKNYFNIFKLDNFLSQNSGSVINCLINNHFLTFNSRILVNDLYAIKNLLFKLETQDFPSLLLSFNSLIRESNENSFFKYKDTQTIFLLDKIQQLIKRKIFKISKNEFSNDITKIINNSYTEKLIEMSERNQFILENYNLESQCSMFTPNAKLFKLIEILNNLEKNTKENILVVTTTNYNKDNLKEFLSSFFILKDNGETFYEKKMRSFLVSKSEFFKRQKILNSQFNTFNKNNISPVLIENILLQKFCLDLCYKYDMKNEKLFEKLLNFKELNMNIKSEENLPSEIEITEEMFIKLDTTAFDEKGKNIIPPHFLFVECFNKEDLIKFKEFILKDKITQIIFYDFRVEMMRMVECIISNYDECSLKDIYILNTINCLNFKKEVSKIKNEFEIFRRISIDYNNYSKNNKVEEIENISIRSHKISNFTNRNIVIDFREMSSKLPFYLYDYGFNLVVGGLEIGDYITSNSVCIERKSITSGDLNESLKSGRLLHQIVKMQKYFENIIILLEFEDDMEIENKTQSTNKDNISKSNPQTKVIQFYKQRFLYKKFIELNILSDKIHFFWSKNPKMTSHLLNLIKNKFSDFLDVNKCLNINKRDNIYSANNNSFNVNKPTIQNSQNISNVNQKSITSFFGNVKRNSNPNSIIDNTQIILDTNLNTQNDNSNISNNFNISNYEEEMDNFDPTKKLEINIERFIRKIDGISNNNFDLVFKSFKNMKEFISCTREKLMLIFGQNGNKIFYFFNSRFNKKIIQTK